MSCSFSLLFYFYWGGWVWGAGFFILVIKIHEMGKLLILFQIISLIMDEQQMDRKQSSSDLNISNLLIIFSFIKEQQLPKQNCRIIETMSIQKSDFRATFTHIKNILSMSDFIPKLLAPKSKKSQTASSQNCSGPMSDLDLRRLIMQAFMKMPKNFRKRGSIENLLLQDKTNFQGFLEKLGIPFSHFEDIDLKKAQNYIREQICKKYSINKEFLWREYEKQLLKKHDLTNLIKIVDHMFEVDKLVFQLPEQRSNVPGSFKRKRKNNRKILQNYREQENSQISTLEKQKQKCEPKLQELESTDNLNWVNLFNSLMSELDNDLPDFRLLEEENFEFFLQKNGTEPENIFKGASFLQEQQPEWKNSEILLSLSSELDP